MSIDLVAAKVYRPRQFRNLRNDKVYREGRDVLTSAGRPVKKSDHRVMRAIGKKTAFGVQVSHTSWLMHEYKMLEKMYQSGGSVPRAYAASENAILMGYRGDMQLAAPTLSQIRLSSDEAGILFEVVMSNVELMLAHGLIHGDLSAYNILYWDGEITIIDFPQTVRLDANREARSILERDIVRVCQYFERQGVEVDATQLFEDLWSRYVDLEMLEPGDLEIDL
jgi:RIO kinase 1